MSTTLLSLSGVTKEYRGVKAVQGIDLEVTAGERLAIIGPNGAGKSTLFGMIAGEHRPTAGTVQYLDRDITSWNPSRRTSTGISRTFQVARLFDSMTVRENLVIAAYSAQRRPRVWDAFVRNGSAEQAADVLLDRMNLRHIENSRTSAIAQGARKSLELGMAIIQKPTLLLLDEPTAGMSYEDARGATELLNTLLDDAPEMTIVLTAHDMDVINRVAQRVVLMARGKVVLDGTPQHVAGHETTQELYLGRGNHD
jgi:branched-chain amino acid transport system ATP-binding protein